MQRYAGKIALVVGGAQGIGGALSDALAREGARTIIADLSTAGEARAASIRDAGGDACFVQTDATDETQVSALMARIIKDFGGIDAAMNLTGNISPQDRSVARLEDADFLGWRQTVDLSMSSAFLCMKHQIAAMLVQGHGAIANTASLAALRVNENASPAYHAAKSGVIHLTRMAAVQYGARGIRVNVVAPGITATPRIMSRWSEAERASMASVQPSGRMVTPEEVAEAYLWLCSDIASGVSGVVIPVDGGAAAR